MILFLHNRYRTTGGEERAVADLIWLVREHLGEDAELLERDSALIGRGAAAAGMLRGGLRPDEVAAAVRRTGARVVHANNVNPSFGWRALAAAREAGARTVVHLHQFRLVCAIGVCFVRGGECTRCHGRNTLPGVVLGCRGDRAEALAYGAGLALWQRRLAAHTDEFIVPSRFALDRLHELGAPVGAAHVVAHPLRAIAPVPASNPGGPALMATRLAPEKGIGVAAEACRRAGVELVVAGDGPQSRLPGVRYVGHAGDAELARLRAGASVALVPSLSGETFGLAAAEAMAGGLPVAASRIGALPELVGEEGLVEPGDADALAAAIRRLRADSGAGARALDRVRAIAAPEVVAPALAAVYG